MPTRIDGAALCRHLKLLHGVAFDLGEDLLELVACQGGRGGSHLLGNRRGQCFLGLWVVDVVHF